jgi:DNA topoisomerase IB
MADATGSNYYKRSFTEYEVEACKRDAAKRAQGCDECSLTEYEVEACKRDVADALIFTAATAMAAKIERRAERNFLLYRLEAEIAAAKSKRNNKLAAMDAEITALEAELAANRS